MFIIFIVAQTFYKMRKKSREAARNANGKLRRAHEAVLAETASNIEHEAQRVVVREALYAERIAREARKVENIAREARNAAHNAAVYAAVYESDFHTAAVYESDFRTAAEHEAFIAACDVNIARSAGYAREKKRTERREMLSELNIIKKFNIYKLVKRLDMAAKEYIKENPLQKNIQLTGINFSNCIISTHPYDIKVAEQLRQLFSKAYVWQYNVITAIHIVHERFFKEKKTIQKFFKTIQSGILRKLKNWNSWDFELNCACALVCKTKTNNKFFEIDTYFKRKCSKLVTKEDIKEFEEFKNNKLLATFLLVNQRLASTGKYVSISILDMLYLLKRYDNKLR